jgi:acetyltransferase-like isoleucine patch superfamily enzyme
LVTLGDHVTVTAGVNFVTHDGGVWVLRQEFPSVDVVGEIVVGDNCFIGLRAILLPGVTVGDNCVIAAGAVVNRDIPDGSIAAGVPARVVSSLADYRERALAKAIHVRGLPPSQKRAAIQRWINDQRPRAT